MPAKPTHAHMSSSAAAALFVSLSEAISGAVVFSLTSHKVFSRVFIKRVSKHHRLTCKMNAEKGLNEGRRGKKNKSRKGTFYGKLQ